MMIREYSVMLARLRRKSRAIHVATVNLDAVIFEAVVITSSAGTLQKAEAVITQEPPAHCEEL
jgi:hypothetical protein